MLKIYTKTVLGLMAFSLATGTFASNSKKSIDDVKGKVKDELVFTENKGQVSDQNHNPRPDVLFSGTNDGLVYHLRNNGVSYQLNHVDSWKSLAEMEGRSNNAPANFQVKVPFQTTVYRLDMNWKGINKNYTIETQNQKSAINNYYLENGSEYTQNVRSYEDVYYRNIYTNIDLHYYQKENSLKYDYIVKPGADYKKIKLEVEGAENIKVEKDGSLTLTTPLGNIQEGTPVVFQDGKQLEAKWVVEENVLSFEIENYNPAKELIIDPATRVWGTYYGGTGNDYGHSTSLDAAGNIYMAGYTNSSAGTIMATAGSHQATFGGGSADAFLVKFNSNGVRQWATYYGGTGNDYGYSCKTDAAGNVFLTGYTTTGTSTLIAPAGAHQTAFGGGANDAFLVKFNSAGVRQWGTYYGGTGGDIAYSCATDAAGNVYIVGYSATSTANVISTAGSHQVTIGGGFDAFAAKFNAAGVRQWGTYIGGTGGEYAYSCATDASSNLFVTGFTNSSNGISTVGSHQATYGGNDDAFIVKFNTSGVRQFGTYYGDASGSDYGYGCTVDASGNVLITGLTNSTGGTAIATVGSHQASYDSGYDAFLAKFNNTGVRQWGTYYGGSGYEEGQSVSADGSGNVYIAGLTSTFMGSGIATPGSYQAANGGGNDAFLAKFNASGVRQWGTYYGGVGGDAGLSCIAEATNYVYLSGRTNSSAAGVIASAGSHQAAAGGNDDAFLVKLCNVPNAPTNLTPVANQTLCAGGTTTLTISGTGSLSWFANPTGGAALATGATYVTPVLSAGTYTYYAEANTCTVSAMRTPITVTVEAFPVISVNSGTICRGSSFTITPSGAATYTIQGGSTVVSPTITTSYSVTGTSSFGCLAASNATAVVTVVANPTVSVNSGSICAGKSFTMSPSGATSYTFQGGSAVVTPTATSSYTVIGSNTSGCVSQTFATSNVSVVANPTITVNSGTMCVGGSFTMTPSGASTYTFQGGSAVVSPTSTTTFSVVGTSAAGCISNTVTSGVTVYNLPVVNAITSLSLICSGQNVNITAIGALTYTWNTGATTQVIAVSPTVTTTYTVTGTDGNGCRKSATETVTVNPLPSVSAVSAPTAICVGQSGTLTASGASTYSWSTGAMAPAILVTPTVTTTYTVYGTDAFGCSNSNTLVTVVNPLPVITVAPASSVICLNESVSLTASGASTYTWSTGPIGSNINVTPTVTTTYTVLGTNSNGCVNAATSSITVNGLPVVNAFSSPGTVCAGSTVSLSAVGATSYTWNTGPTTQSTTANPTSQTTYTVIGTAANGCTNTAVTTVSVNALPTLNVAQTPGPLCPGQTGTLTATGANTYTWNTSATTAAIAVSPTVSTNYTVTGTDANGCVNATVATFTVNTPPVLAPTSSNTLICVGQSATLTATGALTYTWNTTANTAAIVESPTVTTTYTVSGTDANGCTSTDTVTQYVSPCTGIANVGSNEEIINVYPNPTNGQFTVLLPREAKLIVTDLVGKLIYQADLNEGKHNLDLSESANGIYFVRVEYGNITRSVKLIKQ